METFNKNKPDNSIMLTITTKSKNNIIFLQLLKFYKEINEIFRELNIQPTIYGSLAVFVYTKDESMNINDIDVLISEKEFLRIITELEKQNIKYNYNKKWQVLQILKDELKIELDSIERWQPKLSKEYTQIKINNQIIEILNLKSLEKVYLNAAQVSKDKSKSNKLKYKALKKINL